MSLSCILSMKMGYFRGKCVSNEKSITLSVFCVSVNVVSFSDITSVNSIVTLTLRVSVDPTA